jgi:hypothetical protein
VSDDRVAKAKKPHLRVSQAALLDSDTDDNLNLKIKIKQSTCMASTLLE